LKKFFTYFPDDRPLAHNSALEVQAAAVPLGVPVASGIPARAASKARAASTVASGLSALLGKLTQGGCCVGVVVDLQKKLKLDCAMAADMPPLADIVDNNRSDKWWRMECH